MSTSTATSWPDSSASPTKPPAPSPGSSSSPDASSASATAIASPAASSDSSAGATALTPAQVDRVAEEFARGERSRNRLSTAADGITIPLSEVDRLVRSKSFLARVHLITERTTEYVEEHLKRDALARYRTLVTMADEETDPRVKAQVNFGLLDRAGLSPKAKVELSSPERYKSLVERYGEIPAVTEGEESSG